MHRLEFQSAITSHRPAHSASLNISPKKSSLHVTINFYSNFCVLFMWKSHSSIVKYIFLRHSILEWTVCRIKVIAL